MAELDCENVYRLVESFRTRPFLLVGDLTKQGQRFGFDALAERFGEWRALAPFKLRARLPAGETFGRSGGVDRLLFVTAGRLDRLRSEIAPDRAEIKVPKALWA